jgi:hypothetical protein
MTPKTATALRRSIGTRSIRAVTELGIGIIGSGYMGRTYAECVARYNTHARLVAVAGGAAQRVWPPITVSPRS